MKCEDRVRYGLAVLLAAAGVGCVQAPASDSVSGPLTVFNAGSLAAPFRELLQVFAQVHPGIQLRQESTLMVYRMAERYYGEAGLAARLQRASPPRRMRAREAHLVALVQSGDLDYAWSYRSIAATVGLPAVSLPPAIDLSDPAHTESYRAAAVRLPAATQAAGDSLTLRGDAIVYAVTIPTGASNPVAAAAFMRFLFSPDGQAILERHGFLRIHHPTIGGPGQPPPGTVPDSTFLSASRP